MKGNHSTRFCIWLCLPILAGAFYPGGVAAHDGTSHPVMLGIDRDHNLLSDLFEIQYPGLGDAEDDDDGDGQTNRQESAAGTNPRDARDRLEFRDVAMELEGLSLEWFTRPGKQYIVQIAASPAGPWTDEGTAAMGDGTTMRRVTPRSLEARFVRLQVRDTDSDADGVSDWEEYHAGTDPLLADTNGDGRTDMAQIHARLDLPNRINVAALTSTATEGGTGAIVFRILRAGNLDPLTVGYELSGTAAAGSDYAAPSGKVVFPMGSTEANITLNPIADRIAEGPESIILTIKTGTGYQAGQASSATAWLNDVRHGMVGYYYNTQQTTYPAYPETNLNFAPEQLRLTRVDGPIDFDWGAGPPAGTGLTAPNGWSIRWEGELVPPVTGNYVFHVQADRGAVLSVDGTNRINRWNATAGTEYNSSQLTLQAGVPVPLRLDYRESSTTADQSGIRFSWTPPGGTKELVPLGALISDPSIPAEGGAPVLNVEPYAFAVRHGPFALQISSDPPASQYSADGLPAGLVLDPQTGSITGSTTAPAGLAMVTLTGTNHHGSGMQLLPLLILDGGGGLTREVWEGLEGSGIQSIPLATAPSSVTPVTTLQAPENAGNQFGDRLRGYLTAPANGIYTFFLSSDETAEVWLGASEEPGQRLKRSWLTNSGSLPGTWSGSPGQQSLPVRLAAGRRYYIEVLRRETSGNDHLAVGWHRPGAEGSAIPEIIPGWALSPYEPPAASTPDGTLYIANMTPQAGAATLGTGSAILFVNAEKTAAELSFTFSNLTGPIISQHLHDSRSLPGPGGAIIFDIDDEPLDPSGRRHWLFAPTGNHAVPDIVAAIEEGGCFINLHTNNFPAGEIKGFFTPAIGSQFFSPPPAPASAELSLPADLNLQKQEIVRFLQQATFGAKADDDGLRSPGTSDAVPFGGFDPDSIEAVASRGYAQWLDDQLAMDPGPDPEILHLQALPPGTLYATVSASRRTPNEIVSVYNGSGPMASFLRNHYEQFPRSGSENNGTSTESATDLWRAWWKTAITAPDQVRHRTAYALSQILVVSEEGSLDGRARALAHYSDLLYWHGLGNFRTLLEKITLNPAMGRYLDMLGNKKPNLSTGYIPNENFARELLQLFSIGLKRLHPDGSLVLDVNGLPIDTYGQENVVGYAHTLTGWSYGPGGSANFISPMTLRPNDHDTGEKLLLGNTILRANTAPTIESAEAGLHSSLDVIFHHPNVGPFICRQLIQRLVTSNPSPGYIHRAASAFDDNGSGVRGDLKAVIRTILLDPEARNAAPREHPGFGKLKEPVLRATQMLRAFRAFSHAESTWSGNNNLGAAFFSPNSNLNLSVPLRTSETTYTTGTGETVTTSWIDDTIDPDGPAPGFSPTPFSFPIAPGNQILLRRQTAPPAGGLVVDENGDTNSPENGLYLLAGHGLLLERAPTADSAAELNQSWITLITCRMDAPGSPGGSTSASATNGGSLTSNRFYQQTSQITNPGTDPVQFTLSSRGNDFRHSWEMGSTRSAFQQAPLQSPTVFNFYEPDFVYLGATGNAGLYGPEFQITSETTAITTANWFHELTRRNSSATSSPFSYGQGYSYPNPHKREIKLNLAAERAMASSPGALVDHIATLLMPGQMTPALRNLMVEYLSSLPANDEPAKMNRVSEALYLISLCPEAAVQK